MCQLANWTFVSCVIIYPNFMNDVFTIFNSNLNSKTKHTNNNINPHHSKLIESEVALLAISKDMVLRFINLV